MSAVCRAAAVQRGGGLRAGAGAAGAPARVPRAAARDARARRRAPLVAVRRALPPAAPHL